MILYYYLTENIFIVLYYNMSQSSAFANYSNVSQQLQSGSGTGQAGISFQDKLNDRANFEQQFLIGMAVHQKAVVGEKLVKLFKSSKKLQNASGLSEDELAGLAKGDFSKVTGKIAKATSKQLRKGIKSLRGAKEQNAAESAELDANRTVAGIKKDVSNKLKTEKDVADDEVEEAQRGVDAADAEVTRLANVSLNQPDVDELTDTASSLRAEATANRSAADFANAKVESIPRTRQTADSTEDDVRLEANPEFDSAVNRAEFFNNQASASERAATSAENTARDARTTSNALQEQQDAAGSFANDARSTLYEKNAAAAQKSQSFDEAESAAQESAAAVSTGESAVETSAEAIAANAAKVAKITGDIGKVDKVAVAESEADPLGLVVAAVGAIASSLIGRNVKTHDSVQQGVKQISASYASTFGA
mgnify:CR=1 FL=1|jgi:hypothetical protein